MLAGMSLVSSGGGGLTLKHQPVLLQEAIAALAVKPHGFYVDATFGRGGHAQAISALLGASGKLLVIDKDEDAIKVALAWALRDESVIVKHGSFANLKNWINTLDMMGKVDGVLLDLGVSSPQLDDETRGFSFLKNGPLDMRMDKTQKLTAALWVNHAAEKEIARILHEYGEERFSRRIAKAIVEARALKPLTTTAELAEIVKRANPCWEKHKHPATRAFQALRIVVNNELDELRSSLEQSLDVLAIGGRLAVIGFQSLEDRVVKDFMQQYIHGHELTKLPLKQTELGIRLKRIGRAIKPSAAEINDNPRARSAHLRVMEKIA